MKPKYSSGYLTPQATRSKKEKPRHSVSSEDLRPLSDLNDSIFEKLMSCPIKRQLVIQLIASEQKNIQKYIQKQSEEQTRKEVNGSPFSKIQKKYKCESPTALLRRRALEQQARQSPVSGSTSDESTSDSRQFNGLSCPSPVPFNTLLKGVTAFVEVRSKDQDRSNGAKILMRSMGASVRDQFTKDVTHVVFKDGSFTTYQKAKLMKIHLVSILWIEAVRSSKTRVPEKHFPALGTEAYDHNVSSICSQMQRDYEEIIKDEMRRSFASGTPLPSTKSLIDRRRTMMTPIYSASKQFSQEFPSSQDREVEQITKNNRKHGDLRQSPELTSDDDSDLGPFIDGAVVKRKKDLLSSVLTEDQVVMNSIENLGNLEAAEPTRMEISESFINVSTTNTTNMDLTLSKENADPNISDGSIYNKKTPMLRSKRNSQQNCTPKVTKDNLFTTPDDKLYRRRTWQLKNNVNISYDSVSSKSESTSNNSSRNDVTTQAGGLEILSKNACVGPDNALKGLADDCTKSLSALQLSSEKQIPNKSNSTNMSSLRVSDNSNKEKSKSTKISEKSTSTNMSALHVSSDSRENQSSIKNQENNNNSSKDNLNRNRSREMPVLKVLTSNGFSTSTSDSFSSLNESVVHKVLEVIDKTPLPDGNVTRRRTRQSVQKTATFNSKRKTILPFDNIVTDTDRSDSSDGANLPKKAVNSLTSKICQASTNTENSKHDKKTLRERRKTVNLESQPNLNSKETSDTRKTILPFIRSTSVDNSNGDPQKGLPEESSPSKKFKDNKTCEQISQKFENESDNSGGNKKLSRGKRKTLIKKNKSQPKNTQQVNSTSSNNPPQSTSDTSGSGRRNKGLRKLYNPDESFRQVLSSDEKEREDKRFDVKKRKSDEGVTVNPNIVSVTPNVLLTAKAKLFIEENKIGMQSVLSKELEESEEEQPSRQRGRKKKSENKRVSVNSDADEQQELAEEFISKKGNTKLVTTKKKDIKSEGRIGNTRRSARLSQIPRKKLNFGGSTSSSDEKNIVPITSHNRRSTMEFQPLSQRSTKKNLKIDKTRQPSIVCTRLHKADVQVFYQIVKKLGRFVTEEEVSSKTTHLVAGEPKRTINMLRAIAMGCWILKYEWLLKSLEEGKWLPEEDYEETDFSHAVQQCRLQRQAFGPSFSIDIFQSCGPIYIAKESIPRCSDLRELVSLCKGTVVTIPRNAEIVVGEFIQKEGVKCVKETWILDSITFNKKMPFKKYIIISSSKNPFV